MILQLQSLETLIIFDEEEIFSSSMTKLHKLCSLEYHRGWGGGDWVFCKKKIKVCA